jgi:hypothetical protein
MSEIEPPQIRFFFGKRGRYRGILAWKLRFNEKQIA